MQPLFKKKPGFTEVDPYKVSYNVGCLIDIPTGKYVRGQRGENILNGGLSLFTAVAGKGNSYKSTLAHYLVLSGANIVAESGILPYLNSYDTETNVDIPRLRKLSHRFPLFAKNDLFDLKAWDVSDKNGHLGNEWFKILKEYLKNEKIKNKKDYIRETPMVDREGKPISTIVPSFGEVDSISEFTTDATEEIQDKNEIGDSGGNTIHMRSGLDKTRLLMEIPAMCNASSHYMVMTAHVGKEIPMQQGPYAVPTKTLPHMKPGEAIKGVAGKFFFLPTSFWQAMTTSLLNNQGTKGPEFPKRRDDPEEGSTDLNVVTFKQLRSKSGPSGFTIDVVVSQSEGVLPTLTEFYYLKNEDKYGFEGNDRNFNIILLPEVKLMRTTVRETIDNNPQLRRAIKILADLRQISTFHKDLPAVPDLVAFRDKLGKQYGWDKLLATRDYWTFNQYEHEVPFLSTLDLLEMYYDKYTPYWMK